MLNDETKKKQTDAKMAKWNKKNVTENEDRRSEREREHTHTDKKMKLNSKTIIVNVRVCVYCSVQCLEFDLKL